MLSRTFKLPSANVLGAFASSKLKVLIADLFSESDMKKLKEAGIDIKYNHQLNGKSLAKEMSEYQPNILVVRSTKVQQEQFDSAKSSLEAVIRAGSGYDTINVDYANKIGVSVANCPGKNAVAVAELALGLILSVDRRIPENVQMLKENKWNKGEFTKSVGVKGKTLGIFGFGNIGQALAQRAIACEMNVIAYSASPVNMAGVQVAKDIDELLKKSDVLSLHIPGGNATKGLVNKEFLGKMKKNALLLNTARATVISSPKDMIDHLNANKDFWYAADVLPNEPADKKAEFNCELAKHPRVYGTHHIGASTKQGEAAIGAEAARMIMEYNKSKVVPNCVNMAKKMTGNKIQIKYANSMSVFNNIFGVIAGVDSKVYNSKFENFQGGNSGIAQINIDKLSDEKIEKLKKEFAKIKEIMDCQIQ